MRICHITPHLPPDQTANALLPFHLGQWARDAGDEASYLAHVPHSAGHAPLPGPVAWVPRLRSRPTGSVRRLYNGLRAVGIARAALPPLRDVDLVHVHSNGLLPEFGALLAAWLRKPTVLTLYGTEIWHYEPRGLDLFARTYRQAAQVTFYSRGLLDRARTLGLRRPHLSVIYPPVAPAFQWHDMEAKASARRALGLTEQHILLNVKRLHPLAGQRYLIEAMPDVLRDCPDTRLIVCGSGPLLEDLYSRTAAARVTDHVSFLGQIANETIATYCAAADLFVLPSLLEACPTVALEALACGTPVVSSDNPGGTELHQLFGDDVRVAPGERGALARVIVEKLRHPSRARATTLTRIETEFRPSHVWARFRELYDRALQRH